VRSVFLGSIAQRNQNKSSLLQVNFGEKKKNPFQNFLQWKKLLKGEAFKIKILKKIS